MNIATIPELIKANRLDALRTITLSAAANQDAAPVEVSKDGIVFNNNTISIEIGDSVEVDDAPLLHDGYLQTYRVTMVVAGDDDSDTDPPRSLDDRLIRLEMDIIKALKRDYTCGGFAQNHYFNLKDKPSVTGKINELPSRQMFFNVRYYTLMNDPDKQ